MVSACQTRTIRHQILKVSQKMKTPVKTGVPSWWSLTDLNRRHPACKAGALPAELRPQALKWYTVKHNVSRVNFTLMLRHIYKNCLVFGKPFETKPPTDSPKATFAARTSTKGNMIFKPIGRIIDNDSSRAQVFSDFQTLF